MSHNSESRWRRTVLELSLKPFRSTEEEAIQETCGELMKVWEKLVERSEALGLLLWVADGSEILEWNGDLQQPLEWGRYIGFCNIDAMPDLYYPGWYQDRPGEPFCADTPEFSYGHLKLIVESLRAAAAERFGLDATIGATIDPGPEFAYSKFKYLWHPECLFEQTEGEMLAPMHFVSTQSVLGGDKRKYGGFPDGIPDGTSFGTFLGRQYGSFSRSLGFDYFWLSNGFGYSHFAWTPTGELLKHGEWRPEQAETERQKTLRFWRDFRAECPDVPLEVRGTNFSMGMDISTDGASHADIVEVGKLDVMPPNLPVLQADLLADDIVTYLTRQAKGPTKRIIYRTYLNDPWFENNPWFTIYNREPLETYTAVSTCRMNEDGSVDPPTDFHILTVDTELGELWQHEANEVIPHYLRALAERADAAGPLVWVWPFDEYHAVLRESPELLPHIFHHDHYIMRATDGGLPLLTVCASDCFVSLARAGRLPDSIFLAPAPLGDWAYAEALLDHVRSGGRVILYGALDHAPAALLEALGVSLDESPIEGNLIADCRLSLDPFEEAEPGEPHPLRHRAVTSGGGLREVCGEDDADVRVWVEQGPERRAYCVHRTGTEWGGGHLAWIRGTVPYGLNQSDPLFRVDKDSPTEIQRTQDWLRRLVAELGLDILQPRRGENAEPVRLFIKRHKGAWYFVGSKPDTSVHARIRTPDGAPAFTEYNTPVIDGYGEEHFGKTIYNEVRFFVRMGDGTVKVHALAHSPGQERCLALQGCQDATVTIYPDPEALRDGRVMVLESQWTDCGLEGASIPMVPHRRDDERGCLIVENHTGPIFVKW